MPSPLFMREDGGFGLWRISFPTFQGVSASGVRLRRGRLGLPFRIRHSVVFFRSQNRRTGQPCDGDDVGDDDCSSSQWFRNGGHCASACVQFVVGGATGYLESRLSMLAAVETAQPNFPTNPLLGDCCVAAAASHTMIECHAMLYHNISCYTTTHHVRSQYSMLYHVLSYCSILYHSTS